MDVRVLVAQSCLTLCNPMDCSPPGSSVHGILQARILDWVAMSFRGSSQLRDQTQVSRIAGGFFTVWVTREATGNGLESNLVIWISLLWHQQAALLCPPDGVKDSHTVSQCLSAPHCIISPSAMAFMSTACQGCKSCTNVLCTTF